MLRIIGDEVLARGCDLHIDAIAARAGVCRTTTQNALRMARQLGLTLQERRRRGQIAPAGLCSSRTCGSVQLGGGGGRRRTRMAREHFLCSAVGTDGQGQRRTFKVYKVGQQFRVHNDRGHNQLSHSSCHVTASNIKREIETVYDDVQDVTLEGSVEEGIRAATWPNRYGQCVNCGCPPTYRPHGSRGYCGFCHGMGKRIAELKAWDRTQPAAVGGCLEPSMVDLYTEEEIEVFRQEYVRQGEERLADLRSRQRMRRGEVPVDGVALEHKFTRLLEAVRRKAKPSHNADYLAQQFGEEQRRILFVLLDDIEEQIPWRGFDRGRAFDLVHELRRGNNDAMPV
jgi:hypothetical protein